MGTFALPFLKDKTADYVFQTELDGSTFGFRVRWNAREGFYYVDVLDANSNPLIQGLKICLGKIFTNRFVATPGIFPGTLFAEDTTKAGLDPALGDLGTRVRVIYFDSAEIL